MAKTAELVPENEWSERLEIIRERTGLSTFSLFVERLRRHIPGGLPVPTARTWHTRRQPSLDYLTAVVLEFGVSAHWLLIGEGAPFEPGVLEGYPESDHEPISEAVLGWLFRVIVDRGHAWFFGQAWMSFSVPEFIENYFQARGEEPTLERSVEVMDEYFPMLREGSTVPVDDNARLIAGMYSALAAAWLRINGGSQ